MTNNLAGEQKTHSSDKSNFMLSISYFSIGYHFLFDYAEFAKTYLIYSNS